jgi:drug/metabolite transporter (DMT)-like permease
MTPNIRGGIAVCAAMFLFVINDTFVKLLAGRLPPTEIMALRSIIAVLAAYIWCVQLGIAGMILPAAKNKLVLLRAFLEGVIALTFISAVAYLSLPDITAILLLSPLLITALSIPFLGEKVGWRRIMAIVMGFTGMIIVMRPTGDSLGWAGLVALLSAILTAVREIATRKLKVTLPSHIAMLYACFGVLVFGFALAPLQVWVMPTGLEAFYILCMGVSVMLGNYFIVTAYRGTDVSVVSAFRYSVIIFAIISGFLFFNNVPDIYALIGIGLIVASGLYTLHRERVRALE